MGINYIKKYCFVLFFLLFIKLSSFATHVQGGEITYQCLGGNQYKITMALYRDCAGIAAPVTMTVNIKSTSCAQNYNLVLNKVPGTGIEVSPICPSLATVCTGGTYPGVQEYVYTGITTLPANCADWVFSCNVSARNAAITTIVAPGSQNLYIESTLNNLAFSCNSSPTFTNKPVPFICVGQPYCYNNGAVDVNGDSLVYSLVTPMNNPGSFVTYIAPYTATQPLASTPPVTFNTLTGDVCMTPTMIQVTVFTVIVKEYRAGILIGSVIRDIQLRTVACTNTNPFLTGINGTGSYTMNACAGVPLTFNIPSNDVDAGQIVTLTWNGGIVGGVFNAGTGAHPTGTFSWTPPVASIATSPNCFTVTVKDNNCPFNGSQTFSFCITVNAVTATASSVSAHCTSANGSATVVPSGGTPAYTYSWTPSGGAGATTTGVVSGTYTCHITDANGCFVNTPVTVGNIAGGTASIGAFSNVSCFGANNGSITVSMSGAGVPPFSYAWTPSVGTTATVTGLAPGTYTCVVTDAFGCASTISKVITQPALLTVNATFTNVGCFGGANGTATASVAGGTATYTYLWLPGGFTTSSISSLAIGSYTVTVTDSKGCTATATANITQPPALSISAVTVGANCGLSNGSATVTGAGGFAPYTWTWSGGQTTSTVTGLAAGTYTVTIHDLNLCTASIPVSIANIAGPTASIISSTNVSCFGGNNGSATITTAGGTLPFTYLWSNGQTTPTAVNLVAGIYSVIATDSHGCSATANITITQPPLLTANATGINPLCFGNTNGSVLVSALGGTPPYTYSWGMAGTPTTAAVSSLGAGVYNVTVTDFKGCSIIASITLVNPLQVTTSIVNTSVLCSGACNGTATATPSNGFAPYTYLWNNPTAQTTATATGLCAGTYSVSVLDAHSCPSQGTTTIGSPTAVTSTLAASGNINCFGACTGFAQVTAGGGTAPYSYNWMPGAITTATASSLCAGTYTCTVTDSHGCTASSIVTITQPTQLLAPVVGVDVSCNGLCNGSGTVNFSGGVPPYTFLWMPGLQTTYNPATLCIGVNTVTVTDANGCTASNSVNLSQPPPLVLTPSTISSNCGQSNGTACVTVTGGATPYTYIWNDAALSTASCIDSMQANTYNVSVTDGNGCILTVNANINDISAPTVSITSSTPVTCFGYANGTATSTVTGGVGPYGLLWTAGGQTILNPINLAGGVNTLTVTDAAGCVASASVTINEPPAIVSAISSISNVSCFGVCDGSATVLYAGGSPPLINVWSDPTAQTTGTATNLCAGNYDVLITDANGCTITDSVTIITQPNTLAIQSSVVTNITCNGDADGSISTVVIGGTPFYTYTWVPSISTAPIATNLAPGAYTLNLTDVNGCGASQTWNVTQPPLLTNTSVFTSSTCSLSNGTATVTAAGGTPAYTYQWNDASLQTTALASALTTGTYICVITDTHNCFVTDTLMVTDLPGPLIDSVTSTPVLCYGDNTATATVHPTAGTGTSPINFLWTPTSQTNTTAYGLVVGSYSVLLTDANGCTTNGSVLVNQPSLLSLVVSPIDTICYGDTAQIYGQGSGGTPAYFYTWSGSGAGLTGSGPHMVIPTSTTVYTVSLLDANGCPVPPANMTVVVRPPLSIIATDIAICDGTSGIISGASSGGNGGPYTYSWSNGPTTQSQTVSPTIVTSPMNYIITLDDGCSIPATDTATVIVNPGSIGLINGSDTVGCQPLLVNFNAISNNGATYSWDFGDGTTALGSSVNHTYPNVGTYVVTINVTTAAGCVTPLPSTNTIVVNPVPNAEFSATPNPTTFLSPSVSFTDLSTVTISSWLWNFNDPTSTTNSSTIQNPIHSFNNVGSYDVVLFVTNQFGCIDSVEHVVEVKDDFVFYAPNAFTPNQDGINDIFLPTGIGYDLGTFDFYVFDRWGNVIFYSNDYRKGWDGHANGGSQIAQQDVYVWKVDLKDNSGKIHKYIGTVTIAK
jgi:gliding motility-associated-like protein